jgi:hypothetical protein
MISTRSTVMARALGMCLHPSTEPVQAGHGSETKSEQQLQMQAAMYM